MLDREEKKPVRSSAILQMLGKEKEEDRLLEVKMTDEQFDNIAEKVSSREKNPKAYERYRGIGGTKPMSYYLSDLTIMGIALRSLKDGVSKSEVVSKALEEYLEVEIEEVKLLKSK